MLASPAQSLLDVADLCRMFEESESASLSARKDAERDRDYVDGKQFDADELAEFARRKQPAVIDNRIKTKIDYLVGLEKQQRVQPKAYPRTPRHEDDAHAATESLRYVAEAEDYAAKRSAVWRNMLVEGFAGVRVYAEPSRHARPAGPLDPSALSQVEYDIRLQRIGWDRLFFDPHSSETDFSDAAYLGIVTWMDYEDALAMYPDAKDILETTLASAPGDTYDDKPKFSHWADGKRRRVRICQIWVRRAQAWYFAEYTKGGILKAGPSPYVTDRGWSDCELILQSAYVDRDNNRYGLVREMITLQDEVNKRRSKALHLLNTSQVVYETGAVADIETFRKEAVRPDGTMEVAPGALADRRIEFRTRDDLATAHFQLLQEAKTAIDVKGPNAIEMGDRTGGAIPASGRAILASQQGGMIQIGDLFDNLRHLDKRVFRAVWARVRQFWTAEKWLRVTDDERNVKWLGLNLDPVTLQAIALRAQQDPQGAQALAGVIGPVAELDCDIVIDEAPDSLTPQIEQFQALVELKKYDAAGEIPFRAIVRAMPNLKDKQMFLKDMEEQAQRKAQAAQAQQTAPAEQGLKELQLRGALAEVAETESKAALNVAKARDIERAHAARIESSPVAEVGQRPSVK
jgi:hypothetical protein